ncbi:hypothetical protein C8Q76DRAFT_192624 [Earliella scabrosa]|nr:hypothetical protein C8Q76DRAFT_192624 [Earliella scabrosa]
MSKPQRVYITTIIAQHGHGEQKYIGNKDTARACKEPRTKEGSQYRLFTTSPSLARRGAGRVLRRILPTALLTSPCTETRICPRRPPIPTCTRSNPAVCRGRCLLDRGARLAASHPARNVDRESGGGSGFHVLTSCCSGSICRTSTACDAPTLSGWAGEEDRRSRRLTTWSLCGLGGIGYSLRRRVLIKRWGRSLLRDCGLRRGLRLLRWSCSGGRIRLRRQIHRVRNAPIVDHVVGRPSELSGGDVVEEELANGDVVCKSLDILVHLRSRLLRPFFGRVLADGHHGLLAFESGLEHREPFLVVRGELRPVPVRRLRARLRALLPGSDNVAGVEDLQ